MRIHAPGCRASIRNVREALLLIDNELQPELRRLPRWTFARALLDEATRTRRKRDLAAAVRQLRQALSNEGWLGDIAPAGEQTTERMTLRGPADLRGDFGGHCQSA